MTSSTEQVNKAIVYSEPGKSLKTDVVELPVPKPGPGEVLVRLLYSGVCHTDIGFCLNLFNLPVSTPEGQIGGHEGIGIVISHGDGVAFPATGSRVGIKYAADACLSCDNCVEGGETSCLSGKISGFFTPGTFQQYCLAPARYVTPIPEGIDSSAAAPLMCGGITVYTALKRAELRPGQWVVVCGAGGGLGHLGVQYAKAMGGRVLAIDSGPKRDFCRSLGADEFVDFTAFDSDSDSALSESIKKITHGGARIALMCSSSGKAYSQAMSWLGFRGTLCCLGIPDRSGSLCPDIVAMVGDELKIMATKSGNRVDAQECLDLAAQGRITIHCQLRKMDELTQVMEELESGVVQGRVVLDLS